MTVKDYNTAAEIMAEIKACEDKYYLAKNCSDSMQSNMFDIYIKKGDGYKEVLFSEKQKTLIMMMSSDYLEKKLYDLRLKLKNL